jgi:hypothetical protein
LTAQKKKEKRKKKKENIVSYFYPVPGEKRDRVPGLGFFLAGFYELGSLACIGLPACSPHGWIGDVKKTVVNMKIVKVNISTIECD